MWKAETTKDLLPIAKEIIPKIKHSVIQLKGEMGAGKTTLIKAILEAMESEDNVTSPTYALVNEYDTPKGVVFHFDFYRINSEEEAYDIGWEEYSSSGNLCFVEWAEKISSLIPQKNHTLEIYLKNNIRHIRFE